MVKPSTSATNHPTIMTELILVYLEMEFWRSRSKLEISVESSMCFALWLIWDYVAVSQPTRLSSTAALLAASRSITAGTTSSTLTLEVAKRIAFQGSDGAGRAKNSFWFETKGCFWLFWSLQQSHGDELVLISLFLSDFFRGCLGACSFFRTRFRLSDVECVGCGSTTRGGGVHQ